MLRFERRAGVSESLMDAAATSEHEDTEMEHLGDDDDHEGINNGSQSLIAGPNKNISNRQRSVLQDIVNEFRVRGASDRKVLLAFFAYNL